MRFGSAAVSWSSQFLKLIGHPSLHSSQFVHGLPRPSFATLIVWAKDDHTSSQNCEESLSSTQQSAQPVDFSENAQLLGGSRQELRTRPLRQRNSVSKKTKTVCLVRDLDLTSVGGKEFSNTTSTWTCKR